MLDAMFSEKKAISCSCFLFAKINLGNGCQLARLKGLHQVTVSVEFRHCVQLPSDF